VGGAVVTLSYGHLLWANAILSWIPYSSCCASPSRPRASSGEEVDPEAQGRALRHLVRDGATRLVFLNLVVWGSGALVMFWVNQKYWQESAVPLAWFGVLLAAYNLVDGIAARSAALGVRRDTGRGRCSPPSASCPSSRISGWPSFLGWGGILFGFLFKVGRGPGRGAVPRGAQRADLLRVPRDRDLAGAAGHPRLLLSPRPARGLRDRRWGMPSVLAALGIVFSIAFVGLLLPMVLREPALTRKPAAV
jgi:hypothetical protein